MTTPTLQKVETLAMALADGRSNKTENELARAARMLTSAEKLIIVTFTMGHNPRAAAALAARTRLAAPQLQELLQFLIELAKSNAIRVMIQNVLIHQMRAVDFLRILQENRSEFPVSIYFAAYYFLASAVHLRAGQADRLRALLVETKPSTLTPSSLPSQI